ncbi:MAG: hypothetical protein R3A10_22305 [Caldilineaceae bacterium]
MGGAALLLAALLLLAAMFAGRAPVAAQSATPTPAAEEEAAAEGAAAAEEPADAPAAEVVATDAVTATVTSAYVSLDLAAGFPLDPFLVSVNGGGSVDASQFGEGCTGFVNEAPTVSLNWEGETDFVEAFFYSASDPVMVVQTPAGDYLCSDDANEMLLDPVIEMAQPANGRYNIWVGSYTPEQLIPGLLVLTTRSEINLGTFDLASLVQRTPIPEDVLEPEEVAPRRAESAAGRATAATMAEAAAVLSNEDIIDGVKQNVTAEGSVPAFELPADDVFCAGFIGEEPDFSFDLEAEGDRLRVYFESQADSTLVVQLPDGTYLCNDDAVTGDNLNPLVEIPAPSSGRYNVFVGRLQLDEPITGELFVVESSTQMPADLDPSTEQE